MLVLYGQASGPPEPVPVFALAARSLFLTRPILMHYTRTREELEEVSNDVFANVANGVLKIRVHGVYPLSQAAKAHKDLEGRKTTGSTVFIPDSLYKWFEQYSSMPTWLRFACFSCLLRVSLHWENHKQLQFVTNLCSRDLRYSLVVGRALLCTAVVAI